MVGIQIDSVGYTRISLNEVYNNLSTEVGKVQKFVSFTHFCSYCYRVNWCLVPKLQLSSQIELPFKLAVSSRVLISYKRYQWQCSWETQLPLWGLSTLYYVYFVTLSLHLSLYFVISIIIIHNNYVQITKGVGKTYKKKGSILATTIIEKINYKSNNNE